MAVCGEDRQNGFSARDVKAPIHLQAGYIRAAGQKPQPTDWGSYNRNIYYIVRVFCLSSTSAHWVFTSTKQTPESLVVF